MKLIKTLSKGNYVNIEYIKYIYMLPFSEPKYYVSLEEKDDLPISKETYDYLVSNYYE